MHSSAWRHSRMRPARSMGPGSVVTEGLKKSFAKTRALEGIDLSVSEGTVCGLLGPNGAGKTTAVRILTTLLRPDGGRAFVAGYDVVREAEQVRYRIGLAGQQAAVDDLLTGRANLEMVGRLYHLPARAARRRADELLERFALTDAAGRLAKTYSGGMRRRLDLAATLAAAPPVLFLDEPTAGLDPQSRGVIWSMLGELVAEGTTLLVTTQYIEEADRLADQVIVIDRGRVIASGAPDDLKARLGGQRIDLVVREPGQLGYAAGLLARVAGRQAQVRPDERRVTVPATSAATLAHVVRELDAHAIAITDLTTRGPTLDEVFLMLTGGERANPANEQRLAKQVRAGQMTSW
jgi:ABC-2 type transport system ATP-binding protein